MRLNHKQKHFTALAIMLSLSFSLSAKAATVLEPNDIVILGLNSKGTLDPELPCGSQNSFDFVALKTITPNTEIFFSNKPWNEKNQTFINQGGVLKFTAKQNIIKGDTVRYDDCQLKENTKSWENIEPERALDISEKGDHLFVFQGNEKTPSFISGISFGSRKIWSERQSLSAKQSNWPTSLATDFVLPTVLNSHKNFQYNCAQKNIDPKSRFIASVQTKTNWAADNYHRYEGASCDFNAEPTEIVLSSQKISENNTLDAVVGLFTTNDADGDVLVHDFECKKRSEDHKHFYISDKRLKTKSTFDFEAPIDVNQDNIYDLCVRVHDGHGNVREKELSINVTDLKEVDLADIKEKSKNNNPIVIKDLESVDEVDRRNFNAVYQKSMEEIDMLNQESAARLSYFVDSDGVKRFGGYIHGKTNNKDRIVKNKKMVWRGTRNSSASNKLLVSDDENFYRSASKPSSFDKDPKNILKTVETSGVNIEADNDTYRAIGNRKVTDIETILNHRKTQQESWTLEENYGQKKDWEVKYDYRPDWMPADPNTKRAPIKRNIVESVDELKKKGSTKKIETPEHLQNITGYGRERLDRRTAADTILAAYEIRKNRQTLDPNHGINEAFEIRDPERPDWMPADPNTEREPMKQNLLLEVERRQAMRRFRW